MLSGNYIIRGLKEQDWNLYKEVRLRALKDSPDAFGSTFDNEQKRAVLRVIPGSLTKNGALACAQLNHLRKIIL